MSRIARIIRTPNWNYALGEVALIFIGISLALLANEWYEDRRDRAEEKEVLQQILTSINADISFLERKAQATREKAEALEMLEQHISDNKPYDPSLDAGFGELVGGSAASGMNTAAFETLTARGIALISDTTLRSALVDYYDTERNRWQLRSDLDMGDVRSMIPYLAKHLRWSSTDLSMTPVTYDALITDPQFLNFLALRIWTQRKVAIGEWERIAGKAKQLQADITAHLDTLR